MLARALAVVHLFGARVFMKNSAKPYEVRFTVHGKTAAGKKWGCVVDQGWWGTVKH